MSNDSPLTGRSQLNAQLVEGAKSLAAPAAALASGASLLRAAGDQIKFAALDKLLGPTALFAGGLVAILTTIRKIVEQTGILDRGLRSIAAVEQIEGKFATLLNSATLARKRIQELYQFTANSPFRFDDVAEANRTLEALTRGALSTKAGMTLVGDAAAATGQNFSDVAERVGRLYNALSSGRPLERIIFQMQSTGLVTDTVAKDLEDLEQVGAGFGEKWGVIETALRRSQGGMKNESSTLAALSAKLETAGERLERAFAEPFRDAKAKSLQISIDATENVTPVLADIGRDLAPLLTLTTTFKNSIAESTLATKGFAEALSLAWQIGKVAFAGIGLATIGKLTTGIGSAGQFVLANAAGAARRVAAAKAAGGGLARSRELFEQAGSALKPGGAGLSVAGSLAAEAVGFKVATLAAIVHKQAMEAVGTTTGVAAVTNYTAAAATTVFAGALNLTKRAAIAAGIAIRSTFAALLTNPFTATLLAAGAAVTGFLIWKRAVEDAQKAYSDLSEEIAATTKKLTEQAAAVTTTEEWTRSVNDLTDAYGKAKDAVQKFKDEQAAKNSVSEAVRDFLNPERKRSRDRSLALLENTVENRRRERNAQIDRIGNLGLTDREKDRYKLEVQQREALREQKFQQDYANSDAETQNRLAEKHILLLRREVAEGKELERTRDEFDRSATGKAAAQNDARLYDARADEERAKTHARLLGLTDENFTDPGTEAIRRRAQADLWAAHAGEITPGLGKDVVNADGTILARDVAVSTYKKQADALDEINKALTEQKSLQEAIRVARRASESELIRNTQEQADIREDTRLHPVAAGAADPRADRLVALQKRAIEITDRINTFRGKEVQAGQESAQIVEAKKTQALRELEIKLDREIAAARQQGLETASLEMEKQIKLLEKQRDIAKESGKPGEVRSIESQLATLRSNQAQFRGETALENERNRLLAKGDVRGAAAITEFKARRDLVAQFKANGFTEQDANEYYDLRIRAAQRGGPRVIVDALQAVGGGGGYSGQSVIVDNMRRQTLLNETMVQRLTELVRLASDRNSDGID